MTLLSALWPSQYLLMLLPHEVGFHKYFYTPFRKDRLEEARSYPLDAETNLDGALEAIQREHRPGTDDSLFLGLPLKHFTFVDFSLPAAATENLDQAVRFALLRHIPYDLSAAHLSYQRRLGEDQIGITATVCPKASVSDLLSRVTAAGLTVAAIFPTLAFLAGLRGEDAFYLTGGHGSTEILAVKDRRIVFSSWDESDDPESGWRFLARTSPQVANAPLPDNAPIYLYSVDLAPPEVAKLLEVAPERLHPMDELPQGVSTTIANLPQSIGLVPASVLKKRRIAFWVQAAAMALLLVAVCSFPLANLVGKQARLHKLENRIAEINAQADKLNALREQNKRLVGDLRRLRATIRDGLSPVEVLKELTELLPDGTWLNSLSIDEDAIRLRGVSRSSTTVIELMENSPLFKDVRFDSPVTKRGDVELFKVVSNLEE